LDGLVKTPMGGFEERLRVRWRKEPLKDKKE